MMFQFLLHLHLIEFLVVSYIQYWYRDILYDSLEQQEPFAKEQVLLWNPEEIVN